MATNRNASTASRLIRGATGAKPERSVAASDLAQSKSSKVGKALSSASEAVGAFRGKDARK